MYIYKSKAGTFTIGPDPQESSFFELCIGGFWLGTYETAEKAALDVHQKCTGWPDWDRRKEQDCPRDLSDWEILE